jgi:integrase
MSIKQLKPDLWLLDVRVYAGDKQHRKRERFTGGNKAAQARYFKLRGELQKQAKENRSLTVTTFENIIDYYLERNSIDKDSETYFKKLKTDLGNVEIVDLRDRFDRYLLLLRRTKVRTTKRFLSNNTINRYISWAKAAVNFALRNGLVESNPLQHFRKLETHPRDRMLTEKEKETLLTIVEKEAPHLYPIVLFSILIPSRKGELLALKRTDYDMVNNCVIIPGEFTKNGKPCIKPVPDCLVEYMRTIPAESEYLFYRRDSKGKYLSLGDFRGSWKRCLKIAGIENYRFHDQRRVAYTDALLAGTAPHDVMQVSGHLTDMSKVYFGRNEMLAAKRFNCGKKPYTPPVHLKAVTA